MPDNASDCFLQMLRQESSIGQLCQRINIRQMINLRECLVARFNKRFDDPEIDGGSSEQGE